MTSFADRVIRVVRAIPRGRTLSYCQVAAKAGSPRAARAVGNVLATYDAKKYKLPCHRVIRTDGSVGNYRWGGATRKRALLKAEGATL